MKLIVITTETFFEGEVEAINLLFENGLEALHVRKPYATREETEIFIGQIRKNFHARIVIHDYYELTKLFDLKGIHLNSRNQEASSASPSLSTSLSCHSLEEVVESQLCDYVFLSPIFDSISKVGYKQGFTPEQLNEAKVRKIINDRVIALGGITTENIPMVYSYGFGGVAILGALWSGFVVNWDVSELLIRFNDLKIKCNMFV